VKIQKGSLIREGKAKILYETTGSTSSGPAPIIQHFKDDATAFNAQKKGTIQGKGAINNAITTWVFGYLEENGIPTHFLEQLSDREMLVRRVEIIPVEIVVRNKATGSITKRLGIPKGTSFEPPLLEYFYKSDELGDPLIGETHIAYFKWATEAELKEVRDLAFKANRLLQKVFREIGLELIDFKLEFGRDRERGKVVLADEFTPDGCRLWDLKTGEPMDKDRFRQDLGGVEEAYQEVHCRLEKFFQSVKKG
jgi:phosphoribosylaminoimidazole-succinocarboxamide synthase